MKRLRVTAACAVALLVSLACDRQPDDLREWRPSDHHHQQEPQRESDPRAPRVSGSAEAPLPGLEEVTIAAWRRACTPCHGELGRGDGPQGPMVHARDLTDPAWQGSMTDAQIGESIAKGKGLMPPAALPADTVANLVKLVRLLNRDRSAASGRPAPSASTASSASR